MPTISQLIVVVMALVSAGCAPEVGSVQWCKGLRVDMQKQTGARGGLMSESHLSPSRQDAIDCARLPVLNLPQVEIHLTTLQRTLRLAAEHAVSQTAREHGLQCRSQLPPGTGMLFSFEQDTRSTFWMYKTYLPLDLLYLDEGGAVVADSTLPPCPRPKDASDGQWRSLCLQQARCLQSDIPPFRHVLELPAGWLSKQGLGREQQQRLRLQWAAPGDT
ncbi:MAG: DUF192 domain-containing protein [Pseudomonadota bacterium]|nr:DUF192 domain-containing protein [Pseudomonadota bacterium]